MQFQMDSQSRKKSILGGLHHEYRLEKETPDSRIGSSGSGGILSHQRLGGLHHHYDRAA